jgi:hypothetical protein
MAFIVDTAKLTCSCGAKAEEKDRGRFLKRHPRMCSERREFAHQLAQTVKCVDEDAGGGDGQHVDLGKMIMDVQTEGVGLTDWEREFVEGVDNQFALSKSLSGRQREVLYRIYRERVEGRAGVGKGVGK